MRGFHWTNVENMQVSALGWGGSTRPLPERVVAWHQVVEGEDRRVGGHLLFPQRTFDLFPQPGHHLVVIFALCSAEESRTLRLLQE